jgi:hypothetical protein
MKSMRVVFLVALFCCFACSRPSKIVITNFREVVTLTAHGSSVSKENIVRLRLRLKSNLDRPVKVSLRAEDEVMDEMSLGAGEDVERLVDWYSDHAKLLFVEPDGAKGSVEIEYTFL